MSSPDKSLVTYLQICFQHICPDDNADATLHPPALSEGAAARLCSNHSQRLLLWRQGWLLLCNAVNVPTP